MTPIHATKKPVRVEAVQYTGYNGEALVRRWGPLVYYSKFDGFLMVNSQDTHWQLHEGSIGLWIVKLPEYQGLEIMSDATFRATYDIEPPERRCVHGLPLSKDCEICNPY